MGISASEATFVRDLVYRVSAIVLDDSKQYLIETRLAQLAHESGYATTSALVSEAQQGNQALRTRVVESITTNETFFFRDVAPFDALRDHVLPPLIAARSASRSLAIWSAACSTGQEPYSIAMLLCERFPVQAAWPIRIYGSDLSGPTLERAKAGRYRQPEMNRGMPASLLVKYFERRGAEWVVRPALRNMIGFSQLNLIERFNLPFRPDVVFLRNVLIYFDTRTKREVLARVRQCMAPDGALFLGAAETTLNIDDAWERVAVGSTAYYRLRR
jgi:chemotaxis protein methyltransferase CheR